MQVELAIWDTAGQERFHALGPIYYRDAQAALLVYDITDVDSFTRVQTWVQELIQMVRAQLMLHWTYSCVGNMTSPGLLWCHPWQSIHLLDTTGISCFTSKITSCLEANYSTQRC